MKEDTPKPQGRRKPATPVNPQPDVESPANEPQTSLPPTVGQTDPTHPPDLITPPPVDVVQRGGLFH